MSCNLLIFCFKPATRAGSSLRQTENLNTKRGLSEKVRPQSYEPATVSIEMPNMES